MLFRRLLVLSLALLASEASISSWPFASLSAQASTPAPQDSSAAERGEELTVYLLTMGPGELVWERFGHNAIWIFDANTGNQVAYNYGLFDFDQENFILRFVFGKMDYAMAGIDAERTIYFYIDQDRDVWAQELNLTPAQKADLRDYLETNARPENSTYRYDYFRDNCSTRVRDAIDHVLGGQLRAQTDTMMSGSTYRDHTRVAMGSDPLLFTGVMLGLGPPVDRELSVWEDMFLPLSMREHFRRLTIVGPDGGRIPLIRTDDTVYAAQLAREAEPSGPPVWAYLLVGLAVAAGIIGSARSATSPLGRGVFALLVGGWGIVGGILGAVLVFLWLFTDHVATYGNHNIAFFDPLLLVAAFLLPLAQGARTRYRRPAFIVAAAIATLSLAGLLMGMMPWSEQQNAEIIALALPINLALLFAARHFVNRGGPPASEADRAFRREASVAKAA